MTSCTIELLSGVEAAASDITIDALELGDQPFARRGQPRRASAFQPQQRATCTTRPASWPTRMVRVSPTAPQ
jgi:hypothetical protein